MSWWFSDCLLVPSLDSMILLGSVERAQLRRLKYLRQGQNEDGGHDLKSAETKVVYKKNTSSFGLPLVFCEHFSVDLHAY